MSKKPARRPKKKKEASKGLPAVPKELTPGQEKKARLPKKQQKVILFVALFAVVLFFVGLFSFPSKSKNKVKKESGLNVLLITLDTTRADRIGAYGYSRGRTPNLDRLARSGVMLENAYCSAPLTLPSHCSILTGTYPIYHQVHNNGNYSLDPVNVTLAELLKQKGFATAAFVSSFTVDSRFGLDQGFDVYDDEFRKDEMIKNYRSERQAEDVYKSFSKWLEENSQKRFFSWVHFYDPHAPYQPPSPYKEEFADDLYDGEIAYMDEYVGKVIQKLGEKNILNKTFVVIAGDHGEGMGEKLEMGHGIFIYEGTMRVPFILYAEKLLPQGVVVKEKISLNDIVPSVLDMLKMPLPQKVQGRSLVPLVEGKKMGETPFYIESYGPRENYRWSELIGIIDKGWKYIKAPKPELYNLADDPLENDNLIEKDSSRSAMFKEELEDFIKDHSSQFESAKRKLTPEEENRLRSLGYVSAGEETSGENLPDPKDRIDEYMLMFRAKKLEMKGKSEEAIEKYRELILLAPDVAWYYADLAMTLAKAGKMSEAIQVLEQARKRMPDSLGTLSPLGLIYMHTGRFQDAFEVSQAMLRLDPQNFDALAIAGWIYDLEGKWEESYRAFQKALKIEPENRLMRIKYAYSLGALGRYGEALDIYHKLQQEAPDDPKIYSDLGTVYTSMGNLDLARENLKKAVDLNPSPETYLSYSAILERVGDLPEAIRYVKLYLASTKEGDTPRKLNAQKALSVWERKIR